MHFFVPITFHNVPPSVVMSQKTFKGFPLPSGSIQYSPSPLEPPESRMCLQDRPGWLECKPTVSKWKKHMLFHGIAKDTFVTTIEDQSFPYATPETVSGFQKGAGMCSEGFSPISPVFLPPQKPTSSNSNWTRREHPHENQLRLMCLPL